MKTMLEELEDAAREYDKACERRAAKSRLLEEAEGLVAKVREELLRLDREVEAAESKLHQKARRR